MINAGAVAKDGIADKNRCKQGRKQEQECRYQGSQTGTSADCIHPMHISTKVVAVEVPKYRTKGSCDRICHQRRTLDTRKTDLPRPACLPWLLHQLMYQVYQKYLQTGMRK